MKTTVDIAEALLQRIKTLAAEEGTTMRDLIEEGLRLVVQRRSLDQPFALRDAHVEGRGVQSGIEEGDWSQLRALIYEDQGG